MSKCKLKIITLFVTVIFVFSLSPAYVSMAATVASGTCGDNLTWTLDDKGKMTISGSGDMYNGVICSSDYRSEIKTVVFSGNITSVGIRAFYGCDNLKSIKLPAGIPAIPGNAFMDCTSLTDITIPDSVTSIGVGAFHRCSSLTSIILPDSVTSIGDSAFYKCSNLTSIKMPARLTYMGHNIFADCTSLTSIVVPDGVTSTDHLLVGCTSLTDVELPDSLEVIDNYSFNYCLELKSITFPDSVTTIGKGAFSWCDSLTDVDLPGSVTKIESDAFRGSGLKSVTIPDSVKSIDRSAFAECQSFTDVYYGGTRAQFESIDGYETAFDKSVTIHYRGIPLEIKEQPKDYAGTVGDTAAFKVAARGSGLKYQWQTYSSGTWKNSSLPGFNTAVLSVPVTQARNGYKFRCIVSDYANNSVTSDVATLKVTAPVSITTQPKDYTGAVGSTATFKVVAQGTGLKYQWQTYSNGAWKNSSLPGYNTTTLSVPVVASRNGYKFRCVVTDATNKTATSNAVTLKITSAATVSITTQPKDYTGSVGSTARFKVVAQGTGLKYQWQTYNNGAWKNSSLPGYNTATLSVPVIASRNGYKFRCVVTDSSNKTATSNAVTLHITASAAVSITTQPKDYTGAVGSTATFKVVAQGTGLRYQWQTYSNGAWRNSSLPGYNTATLSVPVIASRNGYKFRCVITDSSNKTATSNTAVLRVAT